MYIYFCCYFTYDYLLMIIARACLFHLKFCFFFPPRNRSEFSLAIALCFTSKTLDLKLFEEVDKDSFNITSLMWIATRHLYSTKSLSPDHEILLPSPSPSTGIHFNLFLFLCHCHCHCHCHSPAKAFDLLSDRPDGGIDNNQYQYTCRGSVYRPESKYDS